MKRIAPILLAVLFCHGTPAWSATVVRGPYLQMGTPTSVVVRWRTDEPTTSRVRLRSTTLADPPRCTGQTFDNLTVTKNHEITVTGLTPSQRYQYSVGSMDQLATSDSTYTFVSMPPAGPPKRTRLWVLGDSGRANLTAQMVRDAFYAYPGAYQTDFWLMLGDNAYTMGTDAQYQLAVFEMYPEFLRSRVLWSTRGNHDLIHSGSNNDYYEIFTLPTAGEGGGVPSGTEAYYSFDWSNIHLICLDSMDSDRSTTGAMHTWLEQDLAATGADWIIAFWHHPPYSKGSHDSDSDSDSGGRLVEMRENFLPTLEAGGVDLVLSGHSHNYERSFLIDGHYGYSSEFNASHVLDGGDGDPLGDGAYAKPSLGLAPHEGTVYVVAGNSGSAGGGDLDHPVMYRSMSIVGSMVIDVDGHRLEAIELDALGNVRDQFAIQKAGHVVDSPAPLDKSDLRFNVAGSPFRDDVQLDFTLPRRGVAGLTVYDLHGRQVARLLQGESGAGSHVAVWRGRDDDGREVASGVYFAVLTFDGTQRARRLVKAR